MHLELSASELIDPFWRCIENKARHWVSVFIEIGRLIAFRPVKYNKVKTAPTNLKYEPSPV